MVTEELGIKEKILAQMGQLLVFNIHQVSHAFGRKANRNLTKSGFSLQLEQLPILFVVNCSTDGLLSQQDIANVLHRDKSGIQRSIRTLERDGYLRIMPDSTDRRKNLIQLTPAGKVIIEKVIATAKDLDREVTNQLSAEEVESLIRILGKISKLLEC
ncbi:MarR family transcriptional repressor of mepA [Larkinella arboricola]|uniref:MarR family transcriptional repressor of mepA n=1 Tax=Larkinella arboricola TaxID=643671 RepID=A0A327X9U6_LARAB|nr:MarR family transcriptional regulator [Larkinella arboricola]RAK02874.1 MarR family transcriptional repressor of mepA [Larkinella arboricola]